jgi:diguanylate cyclase (GGDEF)-like protein
MQPSVLIIDNSSTIRHKIISTLKETSPFLTYFETASGIKGLEIIHKNNIDVIISGLQPYELSGNELLRQLQSNDEFCDIPVVILTADNNTQTKINLLEQGASDYIVLPIDNGELVARIKVQLKMKTMQDNLKRSNRLLLTLSSTDPLTGLYNRRMLMQTLEKEFDRHKRAQKNLALLMIDIDHFKAVNDSYGHLNGDRILVDLAKLLKGYLRPYDIATRFGGEEFALVLPDTTSTGAHDVAERLRKAVEELKFSGDLRTTKITISVGIACYPSPEAADIDQLLNAADKALYQAKAGGRNQVIHITPAPATTTDRSTNDTTFFAHPTV